MILQVSPDAPAWMRYGADALLYTHIGGGAVGMVSGAVALFTRKGAWLHRRAGDVFLIAMLGMAVVGACVAPFLHDRPSTVAGFMTLYLLATGFLAVHRPAGQSGRLEIAGLLVALAVVAAGAIFIVQARSSPTGTVDGQPPQAFYMFLVVGMIAAASDLKVILRGGITGGARIARHLWRLCTALTVATGSFFLGQPRFVPHSLHGSPLLFVPVFLPLLLMAYWLIRVRLPRRPAVAALVA